MPDEPEQYFPTASRLMRKSLTIQTPMQLSLRASDPGVWTPYVLQTPRDSYYYTSLRTTELRKLRLSFHLSLII